MEEVILETDTITSQDIKPKRKYNKNNNKVRKHYELKSKKYYVEIKRIDTNNYIVGDFCTHKDKPKHWQNLSTLILILQNWW